MNRIDEVFKRLRKKKEKALILFSTAGDPSLRITRQLLRFADTIGVDCVELGVPFSDPLADGPVIQASSHRALLKGIHLTSILKLVREERRRGLKIPLVLMSSYNPIYQFGLKKVLATAKLSGIDGIILPDLPAHEAEAFIQMSRAFNVHLVLMMTPTTTNQRKKIIQHKSRGFIYYISLKGVTGAHLKHAYPFRRDVQRVRSQVRTPVCVGFGIASPQQARQISRFSDGVIIGSTLVRHLNKHSRSKLSNQTKGWIRTLLKAVKKKEE